MDPLGLTLFDRGMSFVSLAQLATRPGVGADWFGATGTSGNITYGSPDVVSETTTVCCDGSSLYCAEVTRAQDVAVSTSSEVANDQIGVKYTKHGLDAIVDHENRRRQAVINGYGALVKVYLDNNKSCGKICSKTPGNAKTKLERWLRKFREDAVDEHESYVQRENQGIDAENSRHIKITVKIPNPKKPGKTIGVELIDGTDNPYKIKPTGKFSVRKCPGSEKCK